MRAHGEVVQLTEEGAVSLCQVCGHRNVADWSGPGATLAWWTDGDKHCRHYAGAYSTGATGTAQALYHGPKPAPVV